MIKLLLIATKQDASEKLMNRQEFGQKLQRILNDRQWSQADLVRKVKEATGQAIGRDAISSYVGGRSLPAPKSLSLLSKALDMAPSELLPSARGPIREEAGSMEIQSEAGQAGKVRLRINRLVTFETAANIALLISKEDAAEREGEQ